MANNHVSVMVAVDAATEENGCLQVTYLLIASICLIGGCSVIVSFKFTIRLLLACGERIKFL